MLLLAICFKIAYNNINNEEKTGKEITTVKTISIRLEDSIYEELGEMLEAMGQTKQTFYETYTKTALRERSIPFIISAPVSKKTEKKNDKMEAFRRLEAYRKKFSESLDYDKEREAALNEIPEKF